MCQTSRQTKKAEEDGGSTGRGLYWGPRGHPCGLVAVPCCRVAALCYWCSVDVCEHVGFGLSAEEKEQPPPLTKAILPA